MLDYKQGSPLLYELRQRVEMRGRETHLFKWPEEAGEMQRDCELLLVALDLTRHDQMHAEQSIVVLTEILHAANKARVRTAWWFAWLAAAWVGLALYVWLR